MAHRVGIDALVAATLPLAVLAALIGPALLLVLYPSQFVESASALTLLFVTLVVIVHNGWQGFSLLAAGFQRATLGYDMAGLLVNVALNLALIPRLGYLGAAWAALGTSVFIAICSAVASARLIGAASASPRLAGAVLANGALGVSLWMLLQLQLAWPIAAIIAMGSYPIWLLLFRVARVEELQRALPARSAALAGARGATGF